MPKWLTKQLSFFDLFNLGQKPPKKRRLERRKRPRRKPASDEQLIQVWNALAAEYFPEKAELHSYTVFWSNRRQLRTLASCNIDAKKVRVAQELNSPEHTVWLAPLLYHEMCHAVLGDSIRQKNEKTPWHGPEFRALEKRHPEIPALDHWIKSGGWATAVRSHRARAAHAKEKLKIINVALRDKRALTHERL